MKALWHLGTLALWHPGPLPTLLARLATMLGLAATFMYSSTGLTLAHYDAKAHLVVSRRIFDSLTPGWEQVGAVWLPLPHLLNMLPVQIDHLYRTGAFAIAISVLSHALATASIAATVLLLTSSGAGATVAAALYATNPNVLYLQSTPMTEPLLFGLTTLQVYLFVRWIQGATSARQGPPSSLGTAAASARRPPSSPQIATTTARRGMTMPSAAAWVTVLAVLTRYEAWPITAAIFVASAFAWWRRGNALREVLRLHARLAAYPIVAVLAFSLFSRITVGEWFVSGGFFVPDDTLLGQPRMVFEKISEGVALLGGERLLRIAQISAVVLTMVGLASAGRSPMLVPLALFAAAALPVSAYLAGHPFRIRYEMPLVVASALAAGLAIGLLRRWARPVALIAFVAVTLERPAFDPGAAMVAEAQLDRNTDARRRVTGCLRNGYQGGAVMASMGALGHYMHELAAEGFDISDFLHEGNGPLWDSAFTRGPAPLVEWVLVEEAAEGGDAIIQRNRQLPRLLEDYDRICSGGNVVLYRRKVLNGGS